MVKAWYHGDTASVIAKALGRSKNSIIGRARRLKLEARPSPIKEASAAPKKPKVESRQGTPRSRKSLKGTGRNPRPRNPRGRCNGPNPISFKHPEQPPPQTQPHKLGKTCQWIDGEPTKGDDEKCGADVVPLAVDKDGVWCAFHVTRIRMQGSFYDAERKAAKRRARAGRQLDGASEAGPAL